jgi:EAL domain-containing protein (putative c-di-GMP-specific phosphodiesterase class I)/GGDEF domain-containing protein
MDTPQNISSDAGTTAKPLQQLLGIGEFIQTDAQERHRTVFIFSVIGMVTLLLFGFFKQTLNEPRLHLDGQIQILEALFLMLPLAIYVRRPNANPRLSENLIVIFGFFIFLIMLPFGGEAGASILWPFVYPYLVFYVRGQKAGWLVGITFAVIAPTVMALSTRHLPLWKYSDKMCLNYGLAYFFMVLTGAYFNALRTNFQKRLHQLVTFNTQEALKHLNALQFNSVHDVATKLLNRQGIMEKIRQVASDPSQHHTNLAMVSLRFGRIIELANIVGIDSVNESLMRLSNKISGSFSSPVIIGRTQLDQLVLLFFLEHCNKPIIQEVLQLENLPNLTDLGGFSIQNEFSFGLAYHDLHDTATDASELLRKSEQALLYAVKQQLRYQLYDETLDQYFLRYNVLYDKVRSVVLTGGLKLYYQPQVNLQTGRVVGAESLCRWFDPQEGFIAPDQFIPVIESTGLLQAFSLWSLEQGLRDCAQWQPTLPGVTVSLNLSANALLDEVVINRLEAMLAQLQLDPRLVVVELTESALLKSPEKAVEMMHRIIACGMQLSVDDYGVGFSSLAYVKELPAHEIKIDKSFILKLCTSADDQAIVASTIALVHDLKRQVLAEGIEDEATAHKLTQMGCDLGQGWHYAKAMPVHDFVQWTMAYQAAHIL